MRRAFVEDLRPGRHALDAAAAHHLRDVLRAAVGDAVEAFDAAGRSGVGRIVSLTADAVLLDVVELREPPVAAAQVVVASAVPKNDRADWLVEKLCELGVARWVPLRTARSVVHPGGTAKHDRWERIAIEAARQSRRAGVMAIGPLTPLDTLAFAGEAVLLSTRGECPSLLSLPTAMTRTLLIGPEGGWTDSEVGALRARGAVEASLTGTILRVETAAVVAAGICLAGASL